MPIYLCRCISRSVCFDRHTSSLGSFFLSFESLSCVCDRRCASKCLQCSAQRTTDLHHSNTKQPPIDQTDPICPLPMYVSGHILSCKFFTISAVVKCDLQL